MQERLHRNGSKGEHTVRNNHSALLKGLVECASCGGAKIHTYVQKKTTRYRYYVCAIAHQRGWSQCETRSVSAPELEGAVINQLRHFARYPAVLSEVLQQIAEGRQPNEAMTDPGEVQAALLRFDPLWEHLTTSEQETFIRTLVQHVKYDGTSGEVTIGFHNEGIRQLCSPMLESSERLPARHHSRFDLVCARNYVPLAKGPNRPRHVPSVDCHGLRKCSPWRSIWKT
ncbi:MAG: zinc ribbon domain-containing protein [Bryobacteraceae bacterium]